MHYQAINRYMLKSVQFWCDKLFVAERMQLMTTPPSVRVHDIVMSRTFRCINADHRFCLQVVFRTISARLNRMIQMM